MEGNSIIIPAIVESVATRRDGTIKVILGTNELSPLKAAELLSLMNRLIVCLISEKTVSQRQIDQVNEIQPDLPGKTPSQRMRNVLFVLWQQSPEGFKDFDSFYKYKMEAYINAIKENLNP